jgi:hypothetical protein
MIMMPYDWPWPIAAAHRPGRLLAPHRCSSTANGICGRSWASTPAITTGAARTSPASNDHLTKMTKSAFRWTCRFSGGRCSAA